MLIVGSLLICCEVQTIQATVETGWPAGRANICRNPTDVFIDFEKGIDEVTIESTIPGIKFTTTYGINWRYGDIRTGKYNVYPYGHQGYETNGNFFAWLGVTGDVGRIDFTEGATYMSVLVSTYSGLKLDAYDKDGNFIATSGWATDNIFTRTFTRLTVEAPPGKTIAYIIIHDTGNYWLIDDLCTDASPVCIPIPGRKIGNHDDKIDIVFVPDDDYGSPDDIDSWLPKFLEDVNHKIDNRLGGRIPINTNLDKFNFYYTTRQGKVNENNCAEETSLPDNLIKECPFADAIVVLHKSIFGDCSTVGENPDIFSAEGPTDRSFVHESGHAIFGLADEYDDSPVCRTFYFQPSPNPNIWATRDACREDVVNEYRSEVINELLGIGDGKQSVFGPVANINSPNASTNFFADVNMDGNIDSRDVLIYFDGLKQAVNTYTISSIDGTIKFLVAPPKEIPVTIDYSYVKDEDWNPIKCQQFTPCQNDWWKVGTIRYIMYDGVYFDNGWGKPAIRRINWILKQYRDPPYNEGKAIWLSFNLSDEGLTLLEKGFVTESSPNYLSGKYDFTARIFSTNGEMIEEYGFNNPRRKFAEWDYTGPTWLDSVDFTLVLPYFPNGSRINILDSATKEILISVDISEYAAPVITGDLDSDSDVDQDDLNILLTYRNQPASACPECDIDGDGIITVLDARKLVLLCTRPRCACE